MAFTFHKYHGTGNDFVIIDDRQELFPDTDVALIESICKRRFGVGADGLMLLRNAEGYDFRMVYFNSDGNQSTMCGNGGRCIVQFAHALGLIGDTTHFIAIDGPHEGKVLPDGRISLKMVDVTESSTMGTDHVLNTGSPHYVRFVPSTEQVDVFKEGRAIRRSEPFAAEGINVNFVQVVNDKEVNIRTYERGVEDETYSCGTGVTAAAIAFVQNNHPDMATPIKLNTLGGELFVSLHENEGAFKDIWLTGPAVKVFEGEV